MQIKFTSIAILLAALVTIAAQLHFQLGDSKLTGNDFGLFTTAMLATLGLYLFIVSLHLQSESERMNRITNSIYQILGDHERRLPPLDQKSDADFERESA